MNRAALGEICRQFGVKRLWMFDGYAIGQKGSVVLVEAPFGASLDLAALQPALARVFGKELNVYTEATLPPRARHHVLTIARIEYIAPPPKPKRWPRIALAGGALVLAVGIVALVARAQRSRHIVTGAIERVAAHYR
jgi:predicted nucleotidyltransferase